MKSRRWWPGMAVLAMPRALAQGRGGPPPIARLALVDDPFTGVSRSDEIGSRFDQTAHRNDAKRRDEAVWKTDRGAVGGGKMSGLGPCLDPTTPTARGALAAQQRLAGPERDPHRAVETGTTAVLAD